MSSLQGCQGVKYELIYADPAWSYDKKVGQGIADDHYSTMSLEAIKRLPVKNISADNSVLAIWATFPMLQEAFEVMESWGFKYKTVLFNWIKLNKNGSPFFGIGHYTKSNSEVCLLGVRGGGLPVMDNSISQVVMSVRSKHSKKPYEVYTKLERLYGGVVRVELFARERREGWHVWGNEIPDTTQMVIH